MEIKRVCFTIEDDETGGEEVIEGYEIHATPLDPDFLALVRRVEAELIPNSPCQRFFDPKRIEGRFILLAFEDRRAPGPTFVFHHNGTHDAERDIHQLVRGGRRTKLRKLIGVKGNLPLEDASGLPNLH